MTERERKMFLHALEKKLNNFRKRAPIYFQYVVLFDEDLMCVAIPGLLDTTIKIPVDFSCDVSDNVKTIHDRIMCYFPTFKRGNTMYYIDKVDFSSNTFVIKNKEHDGDWAAFYKMKRPVSLLLKELQVPTVSPEDKESIFSSNIRECCSEEDYRVL